MKRKAIMVVCAVWLAVPAWAEEPSLMERGAQMFWEGLKQEMAPALDDMRALAEDFGPSFRSFLEEMGPALGDVMDEIKDWSAYHPPEILENGDIIIRRKTEEDPPEGDSDVEI